MAQDNAPQLQSLGNGRYRVTGVRVSPTTGRYVIQPSEPTRNAKSSAKADRSSTSGSK